MRFRESYECSPWSPSQAVTKGHVQASLHGSTLNTEPHAVAQSGLFSDVRKWNLGCLPSFWDIHPCSRGSHRASRCMKKSQLTCPSHGGRTGRQPPLRHCRTGAATTSRRMSPRALDVYFGWSRAADRRARVPHTPSDAAMQHCGPHSSWPGVPTPPWLS